MVKKVSYNLKIPMTLMKTENRSSALDEIADYLTEETLSDVGSTRSPVTGRSFKGLSKDYRDEKKKVAPGIPNLELTGNMLDALTTRKKSNAVEIGIFESDEVGKADNHNKFSAASKRTKVPRRPFIPRKKNGEFYRPEIRKEIVQIIKENAKEGVPKSLIAKMLGELNGR